MVPAKPRRLTIVDGMILVAASAVGIWVGRYGLFMWVYVLFKGFNAEVWAENPFGLAWSWGSLYLKHSQTIVSIFTFTVLLLRLLPPRPSVRRLARQPGFVACLVGSVSICVGGVLNLAVIGANPAPGFEAQVYAQFFLMPQMGSPGLTILACWLVSRLGGWWRPERTWVDRSGRILGVYWIVMMVVAPFCNPH